jgi:hypothetical protein
MKASLFILFTLLSILFSCRTRTNDHSEDIWKKFSLEKPESFIVNEFTSHDIIFLGETHRKRNDIIFLQNLIPKMYDKGIYLLFYEFASYEDSKKIDSVLTASVYDEEKVKTIIHDNFWEWPYQEYLDVFKVAWQVNQIHKRGSKFRIIGISYSNSKPLEQANAEWTEKDWANLIFKEAISKGQKALVYCGNHHSITKYRQPLVIDGKFQKLLDNDRVGQFVYNMIGEKAMTIWIHFPWGNMNYEPAYYFVNRYLDSLSMKMDSQHDQFAFNTKRSDLGNLIDSSSVYSVGYNKIKLKEIVDGYVLLSPICKESFITLVPDFNTNENIANTNKQIKYFYGYNDFNVKQANDTLKRWYERDKREFYDFRKTIKCSKYAYY